MKAMRALAAALWFALGGQAAPPATQAPISLWRLDCGRLVEANLPALPANGGDMPVSCYLVKHGNRYLLWDAGVSARALTESHPTIRLERTLSDQLKQIGVRPEQVEFVAISHYHGDHTGQAVQFPKATLLIGAGDVAALRKSPPPGGAAPTHLAAWLTGGAPMRELVEDLDLFGDGRVVILMTPGHTPGHCALMVKLASRPVLISGDLWLSRAEVLTDEMADFSTSRAEVAASRERFRRLAYKHDAMVVIQHDRDDVAKLPPFPKAAQ